ncbi:MAG: hypothetical protein MUD15_06570, partial [Desulfobacterota bacterium]|nr:hypothetical protein [Thermodesulfobacteriota bacterium]
EDGISPLTNPDIEAAFRAAFRQHLAGGELIPLSGQVDASGDLQPFNALFTCLHTGRFFHPPCPQCGADLDLVRDDGVLAGAGLMKFSASLRRYLSCPSCPATTGRAFYSFRPAGADPACVKGLSEIIGGLKGQGTAYGACAGCPERTSCHGAGLLHSRILHVSFYPFYLFIFEAASLNASDFVALLSGASMDELQDSLGLLQESARKRYVRDLKESCAHPLLFVAGDRRFLEVLYLKLSFLGDVAVQVLAEGRNPAYPQFGPSLERIWVDIPRQGGELPAFWNFRTVLMDMDPEVPAVLPVPSAAYAGHVMALLWFHALLRNRIVDIRTINEGLREVMKAKSLDMAGPLLKPENIYWEPEPVPGQWAPLWEKALVLGGTLLLGGGKGRTDLDGFWDGYRRLKDEIRRELFNGSQAATISAGTVEPISGGVDDEQIALILRSIKDRWARSAQPLEQELPPEPRAGVSDHSETVVLPAKPQSAPSMPVEEDDFSTETVIMRHAPVPTADVQGQENLDQTVVMGPQDAKAGHSGRVEAQGQPLADDLSETVVMNPRPDDQPKPRQQAPKKKDDDELAETVIMKPEKK